VRGGRGGVLQPSSNRNNPFSKGGRSYGVCAIRRSACRTRLRGNFNHGQKAKAICGGPCRCLTRVAYRE